MTSENNQVTEASPIIAPPERPKMEAFFVRDAANEGIDFPLDLPNGDPSGHSIKIRGRDSDAYRRAETVNRRKIVDLASKQDVKGLEGIDTDELGRELIASLFVSWTFDLPCTHDNVMRLLREAPQIYDALNRQANRRELFFKKT